MNAAHLALLAALARSCPSGVAGRVVAAVIEHESGGHPYAIGDNDARRAYYPPDARSAAALAHELADVRGHSIDVGLMQVNDANVRAMRLTWDDAFATCTNIAAGARVLRRAYRWAPGSGDGRILAALAAYNTGHYRSERGRTYAELVRRLALAMPRAAFGSPR